MEPEPESEAAAAETAATVVVLPAAAVTVLPRKAVWTDGGPALAEFAAAPWAGKMPQSPPAQAPADCLKFRTMPSYGLWVVSRTLEDAGFVATSNDDRDFNLLWVARGVISTAEQEAASPRELQELASVMVTLERILPGLRPHQRVNHYPGTTCLTCKDRLVAGLRRARHAAAVRGLDTAALDFLPATFNLRSELAELQAAQTADPDKLWILKPAGGSNGGGILLTSSAEETRAYCSAAREADGGRADTSVACRYINDPLLVDGRKVDLRLYVLVTSFQPLRAYIFRCAALCAVAAYG